MPFAFALRAGLFAMALFATALTAGAYLQYGHYHGDVPPIAAGSGGSGTGADLTGTGTGGGGTPTGGGDPSSPVPEPGTMALISMGLLALGMAGRGRRVNS